ncbi:sugar isomerase [Brachyspira hampsonii]|uniref:Sugar isomerase n=1 Tax=Brachyspira hampsonii TaxID=1287055 RepID=A0A1E5NHZ3_9SPIR|nr:SIS domain-containing protein [Brachyspira hampsonii]OEJ15773.1 sugar isomerase [Brachyspira hampsonii]
MEYKDLVHTVIQENKKVLEMVKLDEIEVLLSEIEKAKTIQLYAMGRMQLSVRAFAMRLKHMGFDTYVVYDTTSPSIGKGDLLIDICGVTNVELNVIKCAKEAGAKVGVLTAHPENEHGQLADFTVFIPGQIFGGDNEVKSIQPMASLLEQSMFLFTDIMVMMLIDRNNIDVSKMHKRHTNLEGIAAAFA